MFKALSNYLRATKLFNPLRLHKHEGYKAMKPYLKANSLELDTNKLLADLQSNFPAVRSFESKPSANSSKAVRDPYGYFIFRLMEYMRYKRLDEYIYTNVDTKVSHNGRLLTIYADGICQFIQCKGDKLILENVAALLNNLIRHGYLHLDVYYHTHHLVIEKL